MATDGPRAIPGTRCESSSWKWWPGSESNQRHADFQSNGEHGSARVSRRPGTSFRGADRTTPRDRAHTEPERGPADRTPARGPCGSTACAHRNRTLSEPHAEQGPAELGSPSPAPPQDPLPMFTAPRRTRPHESPARWATGFTTLGSRGSRSHRRSRVGRPVAALR